MIDTTPFTHWVQDASAAVVITPLNLVSLGPNDYTIATGVAAGSTIMTPGSYQLTPGDFSGLKHFGQFPSGLITPY